ncbi:MAG: spore coat U domain-containing protein [Rhodanobacteraceae bacterium]
MSINLIARLGLLGLFLTGGALLPRTAQAADPVLCQASATTLNFGTVDTSQPANTDVAATLTWSCTSYTHTNYNAHVCFNIGNGPLGLNGGNRQIQGPGGNLPFQVYTNASRSSVWGAVSSGTYPNPVVRDFYISRYSTVSGTIPIYGRLFGNQPAATSGSYSATFSYPDVEITGQLYFNGSGSCGQTGDDAGNFSNWTVTANVQPTCTVTATNMNFGNAGLLDSGGPHDATSSIGVTCVSGTAWKIGLDNGMHASGNTRRMQGPGGYVQYELYRNNGRSQRWGNNPGTDTVNGTGNGGSQNRTVYGRVPSQITPSAGTYSDTITVSVTY